MPRYMFYSFSHVDSYRGEVKHVKDDISDLNILFVNVVSAKNISFHSQY